MSGVVINGQATLELFRQTERGPVLIKRMVRDNLVVTAGEKFYTQSILPGAPSKKIQFMQLGRGGTAPVAGDVQLKTAIAGTRRTANTAAASGRTAIIIRTWGLTAFSATGLKEAGLFSQKTSGAGTMLARVIFTSQNKSQADTFKLTWKLSVADDAL